MARSCIAAVLLLLCLTFSTADYAAAVECCKDYHNWPGNSVHSCLGDGDNDACNTFCMQSCRGGECKIRDGLHKCHCYC